MKRLPWLLIAALVVSACTPDSSPFETTRSTETTSGPTVGSPPATTEAPGAETSPSRLASHLFMPVGENRSIAGLGELIEVIHIDGAEPVSVDGDFISAGASGISCLRFEYREVTDENKVQTLCVVVFDETGDCADQEPLSLDLNTFLETGNVSSGNADLFQGGDLFAACATGSEAIRLQQPNIDLPPLYLNIVDALGDGAYSLGNDEFVSQRNGHITTYGGEELRPPWMVTVSREISEIEMTPDGDFVFNTEDCSLVPSCTNDSSVVGSGDVFRTSLGLAPEQLQAVLESSEPAVRDAFTFGRIGIPWVEVESIHPDAASQVFSRLAVLEIMDDLLQEWDEKYGLRRDKVTIGYWQPWFVERTLVEYCSPDPEERSECERIETAVGAYEAERISGWREAGFRLWQAGFIDIEDRSPLGERRPDWSNFEGVMAGIGDQDLGDLDLRSVYTAAVREYSAVIGQETPVMLFLTGGPLAAQTGGTFCEADICPSDFVGAYEMAEGALDAGLEFFSPAQFQGFGVALFEGSHFDIRSPFEDVGYPLNRVGETGYNHPILNVWRGS